MKVKQFFLFIILNSIVINIALSKEELEFTPINISFKGIEYAGDTIVVYGDFGSMFTSYDGGESWCQLKAFKKGGIAGMFLKNGKMLAFSNAGEIAESFDGGNTWDIKADLNDSILAVIEYPQGFFLRSDNKLITITKEFKKNQDYRLFARDFGFRNNTKYTHSLAYFKNRLIVEIDSSKLIRFDLNLNPLDTISFSKSLLETGRLQLFTDSAYLYSTVDDTIFRTPDFKSVEKVYTRFSSCFLKYHLIDGKIFFLDYAVTPTFHDRLYRVVNKDSSALVASCYIEKESGYNKPIDFAVVNDNLIIAGESKLLMTIDLNNDSVRFISDFTGIAYYSYPDRLNDSTFLFCRGYYNGDYNPQIHKTTDMGITFSSTVDLEQCPFYRKDYLKFDRKFYDSANKKLYFYGEIWYNREQKILISSDFGRTFEVKKSPISFSQDFDPHPNIHKKNNKIVTAFNTYNGGICYPGVFVFTEDFELTDSYIDSNMFIYYIKLQSADTFLIHCYDYLDSAYETKYTENRGKSWEILKKYNGNDSLLYYQEINYKGNPALAIFNFKRTDSVCSLYLLDFKTRSTQKVYSYKIDRFYWESLIENGIACDGDTAYIAIKDTLFRTNDIFDRSKWEYLIFPYNGRIIRTFKIFGGEIFARYDDDFNLHNIFWLKVPSEFPYPKPQIAAGDIEFGKKDIADTAASYKNVRIYNQSPEAQLIISKISKLNESVFSTNLPEIDSNKTLIIKPNDYYEFEVGFKPNETKIYRDSIVFYSNANDSDNISYFKGEGIAFPIIQTDDCDFGEYDISAKNSLSKLLKVHNNSSEADLKITGYSQLTNSVFTTGLPLIDSLNPIIINPKEYYVYKLYFNPEEVKIYNDSIVFYSNASGTDNTAHISGKGIDTSTSVSENSIKKRNYLYTCSPFPILAKNKVRLLIYWDTSINIDNAEFSIYNIYGKNIYCKDNIRIEKLAPHKGYLIWNCSGVMNGVYLINIKHGTASRTIKVLINN
jgi:hypothetical protein